MYVSIVIVGRLVASSSDCYSIVERDAL